MKTKLKDLFLSSPIFIELDSVSSSKSYVFSTGSSGSSPSSMSSTSSPYFIATKLIDSKSALTPLATKTLLNAVRNSAMLNDPDVFLARTLCKASVRHTQHSLTLVETAERSSSFPIPEISVFEIEEIEFSRDKLSFKITSGTISVQTLLFHDTFALLPLKVNGKSAEIALRKLISNKAEPKSTEYSMLSTGSVPSPGVFVTEIFTAIEAFTPRLLNSCE